MTKLKTKLKFGNKSIFTKINKLETEIEQLKTEKDTQIKKIKKEKDPQIEQLETEKDKFYLENFLESKLSKELNKIPKPNQDKSSLKDKIPSKYNLYLNLNLKKVEPNHFIKTCIKLREITNFDYLQFMTENNKRRKLIKKFINSLRNKKLQKFKFGNDEDVSMDGDVSMDIDSTGNEIKFMYSSGDSPPRVHTINPPINTVIFYKLKKINGIPNLISCIFPLAMMDDNTEAYNLIFKQYYSYNNAQSIDEPTNILFENKLASSGVNNGTVLPNINNDLFISKHSDMLYISEIDKRKIFCYTYRWDEQLNGSLGDPNYYNTIAPPVKPYGDYLTYPRWANDPQSCKINKDLNPINNKEELERQVNDINKIYEFIFMTKCALTGNISKNLLMHDDTLDIDEEYLIDDYNDDIQVFFRPPMISTQKFNRAVNKSQYPLAKFGIFKTLHKGSKYNYNWTPTSDPNNLFIYQVNKYISTTIADHTNVQTGFYTDDVIGMSPENPGYVFRYHLAPGIPYLTFDDYRWNSKFELSELEVLLMRGCWISTNDPNGEIKNITKSDVRYYYKLVDVNIMWPYVESYIENLYTIAVKPAYFFEKSI